MRKGICGAICCMACIAFAGLAGVTHGKSDCPERDKEAIAITFAREMISGAYQVVGTQDLKNWIDSRKPMLVIDTMPYEDSFKKQHIPGAVQIEFPVPEMTSLDDTKKGELIKLLGPDKDRLLVFYCGFTECTRSHNGAMWAVKLGYKNVYRCPGGIGGWMSLGYPAEKVE